MNHVKWIIPNELVPALSNGSANDLTDENIDSIGQSVKNCLPRDNFLTNRIIPDWNILLVYIVNAFSVNPFKNKLDKCFFLIKI